MSKALRKNGTTSNVTRVKLYDSSSATGAGLTGLTSASSGLIISTIASNEASATAYTAAGSTIETISTLGTFAAPTATKCRFKEVDATNHPGLYEIQIADARFAVASAKNLIISVLGATNLAQTDVEIQLASVDPDSATAFATSIPIDFTTVLPTSPTANTVGESLFFGLNRIGRRGTAQAGGASTITLDSGASATDNIYQTHNIRITSGTGSGQIATIVGYVGSTKVATITRPGGGTWTTNPDATSVFQIEAVPLASVGFFLNTLLTETAGLLAGGFKQFFNIASPTGTVNLTPTTTAVTNDVGITQAGADKVWGSAARTLTSFGTLVASIWTAVVDSSGITSLLSRLTTGRAGNLDNLDAAISTRLATAGYTAPDNADVVSALSSLVTLLTRTDPTTALAALSTVANTINTSVGSHGAGLTAIPAIARVTLVDSVTTLATASVVYGSAGASAVTFTCFDTDGITPLPGVSVYVSSDSLGVNRSQTKISDSLGQVAFQLDTGTVHFWESRFDRAYSGNPTVGTVT